MAGSTAAMMRITSASTVAGTSAPWYLRGTVMASSPLASNAASSCRGTVPARSRSAALSAMATANP